MRPAFAPLLVVLALLCFSACGGDSTSAPSAVDAEVTTATLVDSSDTGRYAAVIAYPQLGDLENATVQQRINADLRARAEAWLDSIRAQAAIAPTDTMSGWFTRLDVGHAVERARAPFVSVVFDASLFAAGAAHPEPQTRTVTYDLATGEAVTLNELFADGTNHLQMISGYAVEQLEAQAAEENMTDTYLSQQIQAGAGPRAENFRLFYLTGDALVLAFEPNQVGPLAWGRREVSIPLAELRDKLRPRYAEVL